MIFDGPNGLKQLSHSSSPAASDLNTFCMSHAIGHMGLGGSLLPPFLVEMVVSPSEAVFYANHASHGVGCISCGGLSLPLFLGLNGFYHHHKRLIDASKGIIAYIALLNATQFIMLWYIAYILCHKGTLGS